MYVTSQNCISNSCSSNPRIFTHKNSKVTGIIVKYCTEIIIRVYTDITAKMMALFCLFSREIY